jgi:hypothetical protein
MMEREHEVMVVGPKCLRVRIPVFPLYTNYICAMQKIFYDNITRCKHDIFIFLRLHDEYSCGLLHNVKIIHIGLKIL